MTFNGLIDWCKKVLSESDGTPSSLRHAFVLWELILAVAFVAVIGYAIYSHFHKPESAFNPVPAVAAIGGLFTANRAAKLGQKGMECDNPTNPTPSPSLEK